MNYSTWRKRHGKHLVKATATSDLGETLFTTLGEALKQFFQGWRKFSDSYLSSSSPFPSFPFSLEGETEMVGWEGKEKEATEEEEEDGCKGLGGVRKFESPLCLESVRSAPRPARVSAFFFSSLKKSSSFSSCSFCVLESMLCSKTVMTSKGPLGDGLMEFMKEGSVKEDSRKGEME